MFCPHCGGALNPEGRVCGHCGAAVTEEAQAPVAQVPVAQVPPPGAPVYPAYIPPVSMQTVMPPPQRAKRRRWWLPLVLVASVLIIGLLANMSAIIELVQEKAGGDTELVLHDLRVTHPKSWKTEADGDSITIDRNGYRLMFSYVELREYYKSITAAEEFIDNYKELFQDFRLIASPKTVQIGETEWVGFEYSGKVDGEKRHVYQLVHSTDYTVYSLLYISTEESYDKYIKAGKKILNTAKLSPKAVNTPQIKEKIVGEWDCGKTGYFVIRDDGTYSMFMDASKSPDNVISGTYEATEGIATYAAGYADGITFVATLQSSRMDGQDIPAGEKAQILYVFVEDGDGYRGKNMNTDSTFDMKKIR